MSIAKDTTLRLLEKGLDALSARQAAVANNVANVETPNYKAVDVKFESYLRKMLPDSSSSLPLARTSPLHLDNSGNLGARIESLEPVAYKRTQNTLRRDGNNVDVEREMVVLAETALRYQAISTLASKKLALLRMVAQESR